MGRAKLRILNCRVCDRVVPFFREEKLLKTGKTLKLHHYDGSRDVFNALLTLIFQFLFYVQYIKFFDIKSQLSVFLAERHILTLEIPDLAVQGRN
jgi:hypothetical protein